MQLALCMYNEKNKLYAVPQVWWESLAWKFGSFVDFNETNKFNFANHSHLHKIFVCIFQIKISNLNISQIYQSNFPAT